MIVSIIANGIVTNGKWLRRKLKGTIIAADGGANTCKTLGVQPQYIIGDFDSVKQQTLEFFKRKSMIITVKDQESTDLQKAIRLAENFKAEKIQVFGAIGDNLDHTISNVLSLTKNCVMLDEKHDIRIVEEKIKIEGKVGETISIIAVTAVKGLTYEGLHWPVKNLSVAAGWIGIRNKLEKMKAKISLKKGKIIVMRVKT